MRRIACTFGSVAAAAAGMRRNNSTAATIDAATVATQVKSKNIYDPALVDRTVASFVGGLAGTDYATKVSNDEAARHVHGVITAQTRQSLGDPFSYAHESDAGAFYICENTAPRRLAMVRKMTQFVTQESVPAGLGATCNSYTSADGTLAVYIATLSPFAHPKPEVGDHALDHLAPRDFLRTLTTESRAVAQDILTKAQKAVMPIFKVTEGPNPGEVHFLMATNVDHYNYVASLIAIFEEKAGTQVVRCGSTNFADGTQIYDFLISGANPADIAARASLVTLLPNKPFNTLTQMHEQGQLTTEESVFISTAVVFALYFTAGPTGDDYRHLRTVLAKEPNGVHRLDNLRHTLSAEVMSERYMGSLIGQYPAFGKAIFDDFRVGSTPERREALLKSIAKKLKEDGKSAFDTSIFRSFLKFNEVILKHNFFKADKAALAFRLNPAFLAELEFQRLPYAVMLFAGSQWRGFHIRFTDIARGGVRMIISKESNYRNNKRSVFQENYNLAHTQLLKNKDIPEGGAKGTLLVSSKYLAKFDAVRCKRLFLQYVDAMLDIILPNETGVVDSLHQEEIIFLGPDENTAGTFPSAAAHYSRERGFSAWKSFTTGKDPSMGGIPHDEYGMTTLTVRTNVKCVYEKLNIDETKMRKFQTGGPDGDLGSNEIKHSREIMVGLVDGTASVHDPNPTGVDRGELMRLATERLPLREFDASKLGPGGFLVKVEDKDITLPDGAHYEDGSILRDDFHLLPYSDADVFVPCGGRPRSVNLSNVGRYIKVADADGEAMLEGKFDGITKDQLKFQIIVEGANLFISQDARLALERCGVVLIKDSTANKGGVTSSSLEVFVGLALDDKQHAQLMCVTDPAHVPDFYKRYVKEIMQRLETNAKLEFNAIWTEWEKNPQQPKTLIADALSAKNVNIRANMLASSIFENKKLLRYLMNEYTPKTLAEVVDLDTLCTRVPENYQKAIGAMLLASHYVYSTGIDSNEFDFFKFMTDVTKKAEAANL